MERNDFDLVQYLLKHGAKVSEISDMADDGPLDVALTKGGQRSELASLLKKHLGLERSAENKKV